MGSLTGPRGLVVKEPRLRCPPSRLRAPATADLTSLPLERWTPYGDSWECGCPDTRVTKKKKRIGSFIEILCAIFIPPVGVFLKFGCGLEFWLSLLLTFLGFVPGMIYAIWVLTK
ncbi:hypothetical protein F2Q69_00041324 [Brassica cretica]|uniref:Uncharacterized protein n=1 Tax=Brassica cretica TaxID=69181 RepID=A0A8S9NRR8_BRACR|nr:hypothetical protein F2Q69_00041324 [Brassica cretica]